MRAMNTEELEYVRKSVAGGCRLDGRDRMDERELVWCELDLPHADGAIGLKKGGCHIEITVTFKATERALQALQIATDELIGKYTSETLDIKFLGKKGSADAWRTWPQEMPPQVLEDIQSVLSNHCVGAVVEVHVISDCGNVHDLLFTGLKILFQSISAPNIADLSTDIHISLQLPTSRTYAVIGQSVLIDPSLEEEQAADSLIRTFSNDSGLVDLRVDGEVSPDVLQPLLDILQQQS